MSEEADVNEEVDLESLMRDYAEWLSTKEGAHSQTMRFVKEEDLFEVDLGDPYPTVGVYLSEIDEEFYGEPTGFFVECPLGPPDPSLDFNKLLAFFSEQPLMCRLCLRTDEEPQLVVEAALPLKKVEFDLVDTLIREVAAIGGEMEDFLSGKTTPAAVP